MNAISKAATLVGMTFALAMGSVASAADSATEVAALAAVDKAWETAYNAGDVDTLVGLYDEQAILQPPGAPRASGSAAIRAFFAMDVAG